jgi:excisionase family DNA binding protein
MTQPRFMTLPDVAAGLAVSQSQMYALVKSGELPAVQVSGRGQWRVERVKLEEYIARM